MNKRGVTFDDVHSYTDLGMILTSKEIGFPDVQTNYVDVPGMDGQLDLTEYLTGDVRYKSRKIKLTFTTCYGISKRRWPVFLEEVAEALHGQARKIIFDDDPLWYYYGRCTIDKYKTSQGSQTVTITCTCNPHKTSVTDDSVRTL